MPRKADVSSPAELALLSARVAASTRVWVIDDGDHFATPLLIHFHLLASLVTPGGFYIIADTRLERTCRSAWLAIRSRTTYCLRILTKEGGPARAVHYLRRHHPYFACERGEQPACMANATPMFAVDRSVERWVLTQHPGGWFRRRTNYVDHNYHLAGTR